MDVTGYPVVKLTLDEERLYKILVDGGIHETRPKRVNGDIIYEGLADITIELGGNEIKRLLRSLSEKGLLSEESLDFALFCPHCGSIHVNSRYNCPYCGSLNVRREQLLEHTICGYIGNRSEYEKPSGLVCPKCGTVIGNLYDAQSEAQEDKRKKIRVIGSSFVCEKCGSKFERPLMTHSCEKCGASFTYREAIYERLPTYRLKVGVEGAPRNKLVDGVIADVGKLFTEKGFSVEGDARLVGKSGVEQVFDLVARRGDKLYMLDVSALGNQNDIIALLGKKMDVSPGSVLLIDLSDNPTLSSLGKTYGIEVLNAKDGKHLERLSEMIGKSEDVSKKKRGGFRFRKP